MSFIDNFLNKITMYRVVLYGLTILAVIAIGLNAFGLLLVGTTWMALSLGLVALIITCFVSNYVLAKLFGAPTNVESNFISAFILFFILAPITTFSDLWMLVFIGALAMASKFYLAIYKKHIFNPVAIALVLVGLVGSGVAIWWISTPIMILPTAILGFLVLRKLRRFTLFFSFFIPALVTIGIVGTLLNGQSLETVVMSVLLSWPIVFFGTIMLTEPQTTPPTLWLQVAYGVIVGFIFGSQLHVGPLLSTPEVSLVVGNIFSYLVSPKQKLILKLKEKKQLADNTYEFTFARADGKNIDMQYTPGQYLEWTLDHGTPDSRGNRRYFTIASSPTERDIKIGIRTTPVKPSSFKKALLAMPLGGMMVASSLSGGFTMPKDTKKKLVWISGGIGVTPFRSMTQYLLDKHDSRDVVHFYSNKVSADIAYQDIFDRASQEVGVRTVYALANIDMLPQGWQGERGMVDKNMILKYVPDYADRMFYISGPHGMVVAFETMLTGMGVKSSHIRSDFFPGFA
jgi:ferredoxin-NADP reductase